MPDSKVESTAARGRLVSIEGLNGVGKTYLTTRFIKAAADRGEPLPQVTEAFSNRANADTDLGRRLLRTLISASGGERFLRAGYPRSETLLLLAIKMHDYEAAWPALRAGRTVIEGRSIHSTAVYQSLIMNPDDDDAAFVRAGQILDCAARWRPLPDLTIVLTDDVDAAVGRAEARNGAAFTAEQWNLHRRAAPLFERLATADPERVRLLDRREHDADALVDIIATWIPRAPTRPFHGFMPPAVLP
ncbi:dTMP kinase [Amycolatopsis pigmentata]|uniref:dTMP kinase n=1 Tax=Amycolatopsis pigmentata TaxID=450801 RepID=A0ABW5G557_9PSEU